MARIGNSYHYTVYNVKSFVHVIDCVSRQLKKIKEQHPFDAIAFRGSSGAAIAYPISALDGYELIYVRKPGEKHHGRPIEATAKDVQRYLILDDFTETGATVREIVTTLSEMYPDLECVGGILYRRDYDSDTVVDGKKITLWGTPGVWDFNFLRVR